MRDYLYMIITPEMVKNIKNKIKQRERSNKKMENIKFRVWDKNLKEMLRVKEIDFEHKIVVLEISEMAIKKIPFTDVELMQYTGLKDKNGKEIYDGDIIYWSYGDLEENIVVFWDDEHLRWSVYKIENKSVTDSLYEYSDSEEIEIIGNIYENRI